MKEITIKKDPGTYQDAVKRANEPLSPDHEAAYFKALSLVNIFSAVHIILVDGVPCDSPDHVNGAVELLGKSIEELRNHAESLDPGTEYWSGLISSEVK